MLFPPNKRKARDSKAFCLFFPTPQEPRNHQGRQDPKRSANLHPTQPAQREVPGYHLAGHGSFRPSPRYVHAFQHQRRAV